MRMRNKKNLIPRMAACAEYLEADPGSLKGRWHQRVGGRPIELEIGCGKGRFISETAAQNPHAFFVAAEREPNVLLLAMERAKALGHENLLFLDWDAARLGEVFGPHEVRRIYLNFSDPWPPKRQWKRRLTHSGFLTVYDQFLRPGGEIIQKTDNRSLFEFSLCSLSQFGYGLEAVSLDLHATDIPNIMTEYEENFAAQGLPIYRLVARKPL